MVRSATKSRMTAAAPAYAQDAPAAPAASQPQEVSPEALTLALKLETWALPPARRRWTLMLVEALSKLVDNKSAAVDQRLSEEFNRIEFIFQNSSYHCPFKSRFVIKSN